MTTLVMYDGITKDVPLLPANGDIYAGYDDGSFNDVAAIAARFPNKPVVSIDVTGGNAAQALDVETGDATPANIDPWLANLALTGPVFDQPIIYMSVNVAKANFPSAHPNGCLLWTAHYTNQLHICGPNSCGSLPYNADMTQWESLANYDTSAVNPAHFIWKGSDPVPTPKTQNGWAFCKNCHVAFYLADGGPCVAKPLFSIVNDEIKLAFGPHDGTGSFNYVLTYE